MVFNNFAALVGLLSCTCRECDLLKVEGLQLKLLSITVMVFHRANYDAIWNL